MYVINNYKFLCQFQYIFENSSKSVHLHVGCSCRSGCRSKKKCSCRSGNRMCLSLCHPGHTCSNCKDTMLLSTKQIAVVSYASPAQEVVKPWTSICGILLTQSHKEALKSPNQWLDDDLINAAQYLLKNKTHLLMDFSLLFCLLNFKWSLEEHPSFRY